MRSKDSEWLLYKIAALHHYFNSSLLAKQKNTYRCNSICSTEFTKMHALLYKDGSRHVTEELFNKIHSLGLSTWFLEGGGWAGRNKKNAYINTTMLGEEGTELAQKYLNDYCSIPCNINKNKTRRRVLFTVFGTKKLFATMGHELPPFYLDRIGA